MGYTHYWEVKEADKHNFRAFADDVATLLGSPEAKSMLCYEWDEPDMEPDVSSRIVRFNGKNEDGHETFYITNDHTGFAFCKTAYKPYDLYVTACLILLKFYFADNVRVSSDGDSEEWTEGKALIEKTFGYEIPTLDFEVERDIA